MSQQGLEVVPRAWVTKCLFTQGLLLVENGTVNHDVSSEMLVVPPKKAGSLVQYFHGKAWHRTEEAALQHARDMLVKKQKNLAKQKTRLDDLQERLARLAASEAK
jgi:hypothetical protein